MFNPQRIRRGVFITLLLATVAVPAHGADPLTLFLLLSREFMASAKSSCACWSMPVSYI
jgi:hypothetical protein